RGKKGIPYAVNVLAVAELRQRYIRERRGLTRRNQPTDLSALQVTAKSTNGQYGCFKMPAKERRRRGRCSLEGNHGHVGSGERIDDLQRKMTGRSHAGGTDTDLSWILLGKLHHVLKARVGRIASNREHDRRPGSQTQRRQIFEGVIRNRLR